MVSREIYIGHLKGMGGKYVQIAEGTITQDKTVEKPQTTNQAPRSRVYRTKLLINRSVSLERENKITTRNLMKEYPIVETRETRSGRIINSSERSRNPKSRTEYFHL